MKDAALNEFRRLADVLAGDEPRDWQWVGPYMSQRMFGITEARARAYAERHGGEARKMDDRAVANSENQLRHFRG